MPRVHLTLSGALGVCLLLPVADAQISGAAAQAGSVDLGILNGFLVFFMQLGFLSLESGCVRAKNVRNILLKNTVDLMLCALGWWAVGYAFAHGDSSAGGFLGTSGFFTEGNNAESKPWFFSWTFALCCVSIVSGCLAERTSLVVYPIYTLAMSMWIHPVVAHWAWTDNSWLQTVSDCHFLDYAGGTVVHTLGGLVGIIGATFVGPRIGRFEEGEAKPIQGHDMSAVCIGTFFLWFGWYGFNCGTLYTYMTGDVSFMIDRVALNMTLSACTAGCTVLLFMSVRNGGVFDLCVCCNGILSGLVAATATCGFVSPWAAAVVGIIAGVTYLGLSKVMLMLKIDDPLDSGAIHFGSGVVGTLLNGALARPEYVSALSDTECGGFVYGSGYNGGLQLGMQLLGLVVTIGWTAAYAVPIFAALKWQGRLRVDQTTELAGIDNIEHGGSAYPEFNLPSVQRV